MAKKEKVEMISTSVFAERMNVNYRTALNWLRAGLVPGAIEREMPGGAGNFWEIPITALEMKRPMKPGPKKGSKRTLPTIKPPAAPAITASEMKAGDVVKTSAKSKTKKAQKKDGQ
jgi:hypothetical protein